MMTCRGFDARDRFLAHAPSLTNKKAILVILKRHNAPIRSSKRGARPVSAMSSRMPKKARSNTASFPSICEVNITPSSELSRVPMLMSTSGPSSKSTSRSTNEILAPLSFCCAKAGVSSTYTRPRASRTSNEHLPPPPKEESLPLALAVMRHSHYTCSKWSLTSPVG